MRIIVDPKVDGSTHWETILGYHWVRSTAVMVCGSAVLATLTWLLMTQLIGDEDHSGWYIALVVVLFGTFDGWFINSWRSTYKKTRANNQAFEVDELVYQQLLALGTQHRAAMTAAIEADLQFAKLHMGEGDLERQLSDRRTGIDTREVES